MPSSTSRRAVLGAALSVSLSLGALSAPRAGADTLLLKDGRTLDCPKIEKQADGTVKLAFEHGEITVPGALVKDSLCLSGGAYQPKDDEEKAKVEKGLVPFEGRWVPKAERDSAMARRTAETKKRIEEAKAHREWRNRYKAKTANFEFEYTIPPEIAKSYMDLMEAYYAYFTKQFGVARPPKEKISVCLYHDYDTFLEVSGAGYGTLAYYMPSPPRHLNFYYDRLRPDETVAIMFHESQHYISHLFDFKFWIPHCFSEAFAEYYGGAKWDPAKKVMTTGGLQEGRLTEIQTDIQGGEKKSLEKYLRNELGYEDYTWGWSFVYFLMETPKYHDKFLKFYKALATAKDVVRTPMGHEDYTTVTGDNLLKAFKKYMGIDDVPALEKEWYAYIDQKMKVESVYGYEEAAFAAENTGRSLRAKRFYKLAVEKGSKNPTLYLHYGNLLGGDSADEAIAIYKKGLEIDPLNARLYVALARRIRAQGGPDKETEAKRLVGLAGDIDPDSADTALLIEEAEEAIKSGDAPPAPKGGGDGGDGR